MLSTEFVAPPSEPSITYLHSHSHVWFEVGARLNPNGTWTSVWACEVCPDIGLGGYVGPIPPGYCKHCQWVQKRWPREKCEECKAKII